MLGHLSERLSDVLGRFRQRGVITEKTLDEGLREVRRALLEADVSLKVVRGFLERVREKALGAEVMRSVRPGDQIVKIVHTELVTILGGSVTPAVTAAVPPTVTMLVGLQGAGKTTLAAKLGARFKREGGRPVLVACDPYRPAAARQLETLGKSIGVPVMNVAGELKADGPSPAKDGLSRDMAKIAKRALDEARRSGRRHLILDMAGRLQADAVLLDELRQVKAAVNPHEVLLVADAMTGQEAVRIATGFHEAIELTGVALTKMDGDARGGAALSIYGVLGIPVRWVGTGERPDDLMLFDPTRMADRILQKGDIVGLVEQAEKALDVDEAKRIEKKVRGKGGTFDLTDFLASIRQIQKMGPLQGILGMMPGVNAKMLKNAELDPRRIRHMEAIILSMTPEERARPQLMNGSRRARVARGSGRPVQEVNRLFKQFRQMQKMMRRMKKMGPQQMAALGRGNQFAGRAGKQPRRPFF